MHSSVQLRPLLFALALCNPALAQCPEEPPVQHWTGAGNVTCPCFVAGEEAGATFTVDSSHYPIEILRVGFGWGSVTGGQPDTLEQAINLYAGGLPDPGTPQFSLAGPVLVDGFINEFDLSVLPGNKIINSGPFTVTLEFLNDSAVLAPSLVHDGNGCSPGGLNVVKAIPGGWSDVCSLGLTGDWQIHVVYRRVNCGPGGLGMNYCAPAVPNSSGNPAIISASGSATVGDQDLVLIANLLPQNQFGYFLASFSQGNTQNPGGSQGTLCLSGNIGRFVGQVGNSGMTGELSIQVDMQSIPTNPPQAIFPGQTWNFQCWFRDVNPTPTSNFTDGLTIQFQ
ncbi:MAG: hypothetical protein GY711_23000 [bacterium]|nr:hypothetical protein [bacterium]